MFHATIAPVGKNSNTKEENEAVKAGQAPKEVGGTVLKALGVLKAEPRNLCEEPPEGEQTSSRFNPLRAVVGERPGARSADAKGRRPDRSLPSHQFFGLRPFAYELVCLPVQHFAGFALRPEIPNELKELAQGSGLLVARAKAKVRAMPCPPTTTAALA
jgi:hypothetical protein